MTLDGWVMPETPSPTANSKPARTRPRPASSRRPEQVPADAYTVTAAVAMNVTVATRDRTDRRLRPQTPWPLVHPLPSRAPHPTSKPATIHEAERAAAPRRREGTRVRGDERETAEEEARRRTPRARRYRQASGRGALRRRR